MCGSVLRVFRGNQSERVSSCLRCVFVCARLRCVCVRRCVSVCGFALCGSVCGLACVRSECVGLRCVHLRVCDPTFCLCVSMCVKEAKTKRLIDRTRDKLERKRNAFSIHANNHT